MAKPLLRIRLYNKETKKSVDVGTVWKSDYNDSCNLRFNNETKLDQQYPEMSITDALALLAKQRAATDAEPNPELRKKLYKYSLSAWPGEYDCTVELVPKGASAKPADAAAEFGDDDIPF